MLNKKLRVDISYERKSQIHNRENKGGKAARDVAADHMDIPVCEAV